MQHTVFYVISDDVVDPYQPIFNVLVALVCDHGHIVIVVEPGQGNATIKNYEFEYGCEVKGKKLTCEKV